MISVTQVDETEARLQKTEKLMHCVASAKTFTFLWSGRKDSHGFQSYLKIFRLNAMRLIKSLVSIGNLFSFAVNTGSFVVVNFIER